MSTYLILPIFINIPTYYVYLPIHTNPCQPTINYLPNPGSSIGLVLVKTDLGISGAAFSVDFGQLLIQAFWSHWRFWWGMKWSKFFFKGTFTIFDIQQLRIFLNQADDAKFEQEWSKRENSIQSDTSGSKWFKSEYQFFQNKSFLPLQLVFIVEFES